ncbi:MAG: tryptophan/tyrosine permease [Legionellales bacterium]|nr:tryptophan/tyrosine permease [Legionellales bacterium]
MGKLIGGILLIVGTSIGAGILALPVTTSEAGFISSSILLFLCWVLMTFSALLILEVNLWLPENSHMISMAKKTLGLPGQIVAWLTYLGLLYALLAVYMSGGTDVLNSLLGLVGIPTQNWFDTLLFTVVLGSVVYLGTRTIDYVNRGLMFVKLGSFLILLLLILQHLKWPLLAYNHVSKLWASTMVMITSFGFATIVPSLRIYFHGNAKKLRLVILLGSLIPLICYILWDLAILGTIPMKGQNGILAILASGHTTSELMHSLQVVINSAAISHLSKLFTSICVATSFLGVALCLTDFLADGLNIAPKGLGRLKVIFLTFMPPLLIVLFYPTAFLMALNYAGTFTSILLTLLPVLMVWRGRYYLNLSGSYRVAGGKPAMLLALFASLAVVIIGALQELHIF